MIRDLDYFKRPEIKAQIEKAAKKHLKPSPIIDPFKARKREYNQSPEVKARQREYNQSPEVKARQREYMKQYYKDPEVKARKREYMKDYMKTYVPKRRL